MRLKFVHSKYKIVGKKFRFFSILIMKQLEEGNPKEAIWNEPVQYVLYNSVLNEAFSGKL